MVEVKDIVLVVVSLAIGVLANFIWHLTADWWVQVLRGVVLARFKPYGLTGIWLSTYWYSSGESDDLRQSKHLIVLSQVGRRIVGTSLRQADGSQIRLSLRRPLPGVTRLCCVGQLQTTRFSFYSYPSPLAAWETLTLQALHHSMNSMASMRRWPVSLLVTHPCGRFNRSAKARIDKPAFVLICRKAGNRGAYSER